MATALALAWMPWSCAGPESNAANSIDPRFGKMMAIPLEARPQENEITEPQQQPGDSHEDLA
jgi:hypothetical protein